MKRVVSFRGQRECQRDIYRLKTAGIVGESRALRNCLDQISQVAAGNVNVMLLGETGTGKELFARAIHDHSGRAKGPFVPLDCACITDSLLEARMFGHMKGFLHRGGPEPGGHGPLGAQGELVPG